MLFTNIVISFKSFGNKLISSKEILFLSNDKLESELKKLISSLCLSSIKSSSLDCLDFLSISLLFSFPLNKLILLISLFIIKFFLDFLTSFFWPSFK